MADKESRSGRGTKILCLNLAHFSTTLQLLICSCGVMTFYLLYGYIQELMFRTREFRQFGWSLTLFQFAMYSLFSYSERFWTRDLKRHIPLKVYFQLALYTVATMGFSNAAVGYLNYPTQVIFKSCKLIPVLVGGILIQGKKYGLLDFVAAACMSTGLILFTLADNKVSPNFDPSGYIMICMALVADAIIGNVQEKKMKAYGATNSEMILYSYSIGFLYILLYTVAHGEIFESLPFFIEHPKETFGYGLIFCFTGYLGISIVLTLVRNFGAFIAVTVTTLRKALTIILSFALFAKPFTFQYVWSGLLVLFGIYLNVYSKNRVEWNDRLIRCVQRPVTMVQKLLLFCRRSSVAQGDPFIV